MKYISALNLEELQALTWFYSCESIGKPQQATHTINPLIHTTKQPLVDHLKNIVKVKRIDDEDLQDMVETWTLAKDNATVRLVTENGNNDSEVHANSVPVSAQASVPASAQASVPVSPISVQPSAQVAATSASAPSSANGVSNAIGRSRIDHDNEVQEILSISRYNTTPASTSSSSDRVKQSTKGVDMIEKWSPYGDIKIEDWMKKVQLVKKMWCWTDDQAIDAIQLRLSDPHAFNNLTDFIKLKTTPTHTVTFIEVKTR